MAEVRLTPSLPAAAPAAPTRSSDAVRAAQRAFFDTALNAAQTQHAPRPATAAAAATAAPRVEPTRADRAAGHAPEAAGTDGRTPRPGSVVDIRV